MNSLLRGQVANVLNEREVAINLGASQGIRPGMKFRILAKEPTLVTDPSTNEQLGEIDRVKANVKVTEVFERFSVARTYETYEVNVGGTGAPLFDLSSTFSVLVPRKVVTRVKTLRVDESDLPGDLSSEESIVKVGDRIVQIADESET
jgi:hypothetical protein